MSDFTWIILAAGSSTRLGQAKQLLRLGNQSLIQHQIQTLLATKLPVCVVTGATDVSTELPIHPMLSVIHNPLWQKGLGTSVTLAQHIHPNKHIGWVLVDQYGITTAQALAFYHHWQDCSSEVLVSRYGKSVDTQWGVPVITTANLMVQAIEPKHGLKPWLLANQHQITLHFFAWPQAQLDIDTPEQWQRIQQLKHW